MEANVSPGSSCRVLARCYIRVQRCSKFYPPLKFRHINTQSTRILYEMCDFLANLFKLLKLVWSRIRFTFIIIFSRLYFIKYIGACARVWIVEMVLAKIYQNNDTFFQVRLHTFAVLRTYRMDSSQLVRAAWPFVRACISLVLSLSSVFVARTRESFCTVRCYIRPHRSASEYTCVLLPDRDD